LVLQSELDAPFNLGSRMGTLATMSG